MNIGEAAKASGVSAKMIRYYESTGLIPAAGRTGSGYRVYSDTEVQMLRFIRRSRDLGFPVEKIEELLALWRDRSRQSSDVKRLALEQINGLERKISEMQAMMETLATSCRCMLRGSSAGLSNSNRPREWPQPRQQDWHCKEDWSAQF